MNTRGDISEQFFVVTGGNDGIGFETVRLLCKLNAAHVTFTGRSQQKLDIAVSKLKAEFPESHVTGAILELASLKSVECFVAEYKARNIPLNGLILNAGIQMPPHKLTEDGFELTFQVNLLSHVYLSLLLIDVMKQSPPSRLVVVASDSYKTSFMQSVEDINLDRLSPTDPSKFSGFSAYNDTKLACILFANEFNAHFCKFGVTAHSLHPGSLVRTKLANHVWWIRWLSYLYKPFSVSVEKAAETEVFVAINEQPVKTPGLYWRLGWTGHYSFKVGTPEMSKALWNLCQNCLGETRNFHI